LRPTRPFFVELDLRGARSHDCVLEIEDARGAKITLRLPDAGSVDVAALTDAFLGRKR
jgi:hypothetical protein